MHPTAARVQAVLRAQGCAAEVIHVPDSTRTAPEAAAALGTSVAQIVKSLVFLARDPVDAAPVARGRPVLVLTSGINRASIEKPRAILGATVTRPDADPYAGLPAMPSAALPRALMTRRRAC